MYGYPQANDEAPDKRVRPLPRANACIFQDATGEGTPGKFRAEGGLRNADTGFRQSPRKQYPTMSAPLSNSHPLDDPIARFDIAVNEFLSMRRNVDPPPKHDTGNPLQDLMQNWEEAKRHIQRCREALVGAQPEVTDRLEAIISVGNEIKALTDDPNIVKPVDGVVIRATDERAEIGNIIPSMARATSIPTVMSLLGELLGLGTRSVARRREILKLLTDLRAYFLLQPPPQTA
jgi:hypothetical protein